MKKRIFSAGLFAITILTLVILFFFQSVERKASVNVVWKEHQTIIVDAGHGGFDGGAESPDGKYIEKNVNLEIAKKLQLSLLRRGFTVVMTRETDTALGHTKNEDKRQRILIMNDYPDAVYISVHCNTFPDERYGGLQVFFPKGSIESRALANEIQSSVKENVLKDNNRKAQSGSRSIYLLNAATITTVIVECGFLSNQQDLQMLIRAEHQQELADAITSGVQRYIEAATKKEVNPGE